MFIGAILAWVMISVLGFAMILTSPGWWKDFGLVLQILALVMIYVEYRRYGGGK